MKKLVAPVLCALMLSACAGTAGRNAKGAKSAPEKRPDWADGQSAEYPRTRFLTGIASADDPETAKDRARAEISKVFSTRITADTYSTASEYSADSQGKQLSSSSQDVSQAVRATSQKTLEGVEIARAWRDPAEGRHYALAVLERSKALAALDARLSELDTRTEGLNSGLSTAAGRMEKAKFAMKLLALLKDRESLVADIRVLRPGASAEPGFDANAARRGAAGALAALDVALSISPENQERIAAEITRTLNTLGFQAKTSPAQDADIAVECAAEFEAVADTNAESRWKWSRGSAAVSLKDIKASKVFLSFNASAKEAAAAEKEARLKAETSLGKKIGTEISKGITTYFENQ